jgi:hypothetical protein
VKSNFPTNLLLSPSHSSSSTPFVILNLFQDNRRRFFVILKQVQDDERGFQDNRRRLLVMLKQVQHDDRGLGGCAKNHFPTNNHIGYSSRVSQAAVRNAGRDDGNADGATCWHGRRDRVRASAHKMACCIKL